MCFASNFRNPQNLYSKLICSSTPTVVTLIIEFHFFSFLVFPSNHPSPHPSLFLHSHFARIKTSPTTSTSQHDTPGELSPEPEPLTKRAHFPPKIMLSVCPPWLSRPSLRHQRAANCPLSPKAPTAAAAAAAAHIRGPLCSVLLRDHRAAAGNNAEQKQLVWGSVLSNLCGSAVPLTYEDKRTHSNSSSHSHSSSNIHVH